MQRLTTQITSLCINRSRLLMVQEWIIGRLYNLLTQKSGQVCNGLNEIWLKSTFHSITQMYLRNIIRRIWKEFRTLHRHC